MKRTMFTTPYAVTTRCGVVYHAVANGEMLTGDFRTVDAQFKAAKKAHEKARREARKATR